jgi:hypothetical protein
MALGPMACSSSTQITTEPAGALVRIDNIPQGNSPVTYSEGSVWVWTRHNVMLEKPGYRQQMGILRADFVPANIILGVVAFLCFFPMAWVALVGEYQPQYHFVLQRKSALETADLVEDPIVEFGQTAAFGRQNVELDPIGASWQNGRR